MEEQEDEEEKEKPDYFYRLICLVVDLGTEVLLKLFLKDIPQGQTVEAFLNSKANVLNKLKNKKVFNDLQILNATSPDVSRFDISLLYILISNLTNIQSPIGGWYIACPIPSDPSAGALLMNLRRVRNEAIAHWPRGKMKKSDFEKYWNEAKDILIKLAGEVSQAKKESVKAEIDITKVKQLVGDMGDKIEALRLWAEQDRNCEKTLSILEEVNKKIDQQGSVLRDIGPIKSSIQVVEAQVLRDIGPIKSSIQAVEAQMNTTIDQQGSVLRDIGPIKSSIQAVEAQINTTVQQFDQQSKVLEDIKTHIQTMTDKNRPISGTSSGTESSLPEMINTRPKEESEYFIAKTKLRTEIMDHYKETGCSTTAVPALMDGEEVHIDEIFVMPSMRVRKNMATGRESRNNMPGSSEAITTIHELYQKDGQSIRRVCISGNAGQGKTTLCRKIVSTWCKIHAKNENVADTDHQFLKSFDLLFYLPLRNNKLSDVIEMIKTEIVREASHNALKQVLIKESENCLIILDGLDEWLPSEDCKHKVPYIDPKEKFTVLITSRPWKLEVLRPKMSEIGQDVELDGIKDDKLIEAVVNLLNNKYAKERNWKHFKYTSDNKYSEQNATYRKLEHLAEVPIILTQMVCMWHDDEQFGYTRVEIYSKMLDYLFHVADKRHQEGFNSAWMKPQRSTNTQLVKVFKDFTFCEKYSEIVFKLSDLAYHTLFNEERENSLVFPHSVTKIYKLTENDVKFCLFVGILSQTICPCKASSHTKSISFLHKTFQEFLAALYIASGGKDRIVTIMLQSLKYLDDVFEMSQVLIFLSGLKPDLLGDMSHHIAQLTDKDERVLKYRNSIRRKHKSIIDTLQDIIYNCIVEVPKHSMLDNKVELRDVVLNEDVKAEKMIPYLNLENVKSWYQRWNTIFRDLTKLNDLVKLGICIKSQHHIDHVTSTVERYASSLTCLSFDFTLLDESVQDNCLTSLNNIRHLTCVQLEDVDLTHLHIEYLGTTLSQSTQLKEIDLNGVMCRTCQDGQCSYRIDLSHHKQLQYLCIWELDGDIVLSNEVPVECCEIREVKCAASILDSLKSSTHLHELNVEDDQSLLYHTNRITSTTTTIQDDEREVHPTPLCLSKVLTDVIPTFKNLRELELWYIDFKQDILRLSPEMTSLEVVNICCSTMTLQCLQGFIDSLPQIQFCVSMFKVFICPKEDTTTAVKYITDRIQKKAEVISSDFTEDGGFNLKFTNTPPHKSSTNLWIKLCLTNSIL